MYPSNYLALQSFFDTFKGELWSWKNVSSNGPKWSFTQYEDPCDQSWQGIKCDDNYFIRNLSLPNYNIVGLFDDISDELFQNLSTLAYMDLSSNFFMGSIPSTISSLVNVTFLNLSMNFISNSIPLQINYLQKLEVLDLSYNSLSKSIPSTLFTLSSLQRVFVATNKLTGTIFPSLYQLTSLLDASFENNMLEGELHTDISRLVNLQKIVLSLNKFHGRIPSSLYLLPKLEIFFCSLNSLTGKIPTNIGLALSLIAFDFSANDLTGPIPSSIGQLTNLNYMNLVTNHLTGTIPSELGDMSAVRYLWISDCRLTGSIPSSLGRLPKLRILYLFGNDLTGAIPSSLGASTTLRELHLFYNKLYGSLPSELGSINSPLTYLNLDHNLLTGTVPTTYSKLQNITYLDLSFNSLTGSADSAIFGDTSKLKGLVLSSNCFDLFTSYVCKYVALESIIMDGLSVPYGGNTCSRKNVPSSGSIPACIWSLPHINTLHLSSNRLTGRLPEQNISDALLFVNVAYNKLSGTFPLYIQSRYFEKLDISHNKIAGSIHQVLRTPLKVSSSSSSSSSFNYSFSTNRFITSTNRLSGTIPVYNLTQLGFIDVLIGNMFTCVIGGMPENDENYIIYSCGSSSYDSALIVLLSITFTLFLLVSVCYVQNRLCKKLKRTLRGSSEGRRGDLSVSSAIASSSTASPSFSFSPSSPSFSFFTHSPTIATSFSSSLSSSSSPSPTSSQNFYTHLRYWYSLKSDARIQRHMPSLYQFLKAMDNMYIFLKYLSILTILLPCLIYLSLKVNDDDLIYTTYEYQYSWLVSAAFLVGHTPAALVFIMYIIVVFSVLYAAFMNYEINYSSSNSNSNSNSSSDRSRESSHRISADVSRYSSSEDQRVPDRELVTIQKKITPNDYGIKTCNNTTIVAPANELNQQPDNITSFIEGLISRYNVQKVKKILQIGAFFCLLALIISGFYVGYVSARLFIGKIGIFEFVTSVFSTVWLAGVLPAAIDWASPIIGMSDNEQLTLFSLLSVYSVIFAPIFAILFIDSSCFRDVVIDAEPITVTYLSQTCSIANAVTGDCYEYQIVETDTFFPPFIYLNQCSSTVITDYSTILIYSATLSLSLRVFQCYIARYSYKNVSKCMHACLPNILWPLHTTCLPINKILASIVVDVLVLLTFGIAVPPVGVAVLVGSLVENRFWMLVISRAVLTVLNEKNGSVNIDHDALGLMLLKEASCSGHSHQEDPQKCPEKINVAITPLECNSKSDNAAPTQVSMLSTNAFNSVTITSVNDDASNVNPRGDSEIKATQVDGKVGSVDKTNDATQTKVIIDNIIVREYQKEIAVLRLMEASTRSVNAKFLLQLCQLVVVTSSIFVALYLLDILLDANERSAGTAFVVLTIILPILIIGVLRFKIYNKAYLWTISLRDISKDNADDNEHSDSIRDSSLSGHLASESQIGQTDTANVVTSPINNDVA